ncbi:MAG: aldehyde dehydrogenase family protein [Chromatiales bacterium]|jgi:phenylacetaldehyde dehydrogenase|nr:aldehyde dehydrogenase family protein [Chromatiales bacterium]
MSAAAQTLTPSAEARSFLDREHRLLIGGEWVKPARPEQIEVIDPATEARLATVAGAGAEDVDRAVKAARQAFRGEWSRLTSYERTRLIWKLADELEANLPLATELEVLDNGMPKMVAMYSIAKFGGEFLRYYAGWATKIHGETIPVSPAEARNGDSLTYTRREPIGVVGAIIPWNAPLIMAILKLAPALAAGCTVVLKPAEQTPLTALFLGELVRRAGIPPGVVNILPGYGESAGAALAAHPDVDKIAFTGSTEVGKKIILAAAGNLKRVTLELGGKSPMVVFPDADLERVIPGVTRGAFFLQGQNCMAGTRLFVHEQIFDTVVERVAAMANGFRIGQGLRDDVDLGPLISAEQRERVMGYVDAGRNSGATLVCGGEPLPGKGFFMRPTLFSHTTMDMKIAREEIFGPVLCVQSFADSDLQKVADEANRSIYGLSGSVWTRDISVGHRMAAMIDSGQVSINCHAAVDPAIPFGGNKQSGWGREFGREGLEPYLKTKATTVLY